MKVLYHRSAVHDVRQIPEDRSDGFAFLAGHFEGAHAGGEEDLFEGQAHGEGDGGVEIIGTDGVFGDACASAQHWRSRLRVDCGVRCHAGEEWCARNASAQIP